MGYVCEYHSGTLGDSEDPLDTGTLSYYRFFAYCDRCGNWDISTRTRGAPVGCNWFVGNFLLASYIILGIIAAFTFIGVLFFFIWLFITDEIFKDTYDQDVKKKKVMTYCPVCKVEWSLFDEVVHPKRCTYTMRDVPKYKAHLNLDEDIEELHGHGCEER